MNVDVVVLGCGWAGVIASEIISERGYQVTCLEREDVIGGLLRTEIINGFTIDTGGSHVIFSKNKEVLGRIISILGGNVVYHYRNSFIRLGDILVPYPLENGLHVLPVEERYEAIVSFLEALQLLKDNWAPRNLEEWIRGFFGKWIANKYLIPYNEKIWKRPLNEIDVDWVFTPGRLPIPDWREVVKSALGIPTMGYVEQARFYYPARGGIHSLAKRVFERALSLGARFLTNFSVNSIRKTGNHFVINGNIECKRIVNTIPIPELIEISELLQHELREIKDFDYNKVVIVAIALDEPAPNHHWIYVPDKDISFHRYAWISNYSPYNSPPGKSLLIAEITIPKGAKIPADISERVLRDFERLGAIDTRKVIFEKTYVHEYGYPIHTLNLSSKRSEILQEMERLGITSVGRWGKWRYLNMDMVLADVLASVGFPI